MFDLLQIKRDVEVWVLVLCKPCCLSDFSPLGLVGGFFCLFLFLLFVVVCSFVCLGFVVLFWFALLFEKQLPSTLISSQKCVLETINT